MAGDPERRQGESGASVLLLLIFAAIVFFALAVIVLEIIRFICAVCGCQKSADWAKRWRNKAAYLFFSFLILPVMIFVIMLFIDFAMIAIYIMIFVVFIYVLYKPFIYLPAYILNRPTANRLKQWEKRVFHRMSSAFDSVYKKFERSFNKLSKRTIWEKM